MTNKDQPKIDALLIGYENQENLGLRSILSYLEACGYTAVLVPFVPGRHAEIQRAVERHRPRIIGFSLIFQYALDDFGQLMEYLRHEGSSCHFTAGGHFPSLRPEEAMELLPQLNSVVCGEGELTLAELLEKLDQPGRWMDIPGLAFRRNGRIEVTPARPLITDLDRLPVIHRDDPMEAGPGIKMASILSSRGCLFNCSFCSIRQFYGSTPGPLRRVRSAQAVVDEMAGLYEEKDVRFFIFQDDDFAARSPRQRRWLQTFMQALSKAGLKDRIKWKISCRVDDLDSDILDGMLEHGLIGVYLGVESGNQRGLRTLNKLVSVEQNLNAIDLLKRYDVAMAIGFMLFDPSSTITTVRENINFLRISGNDGYFPVNFCKMLPYAGTRIESQLRQSGRLKGTAARPDYDFLDPRLNWYAFLVHRIFNQRNFHPHGLVARLQQATFDCKLSFSLSGKRHDSGYEDHLRHLVARCNDLAIQTLETLLDAYESPGYDALIDEKDTLVKIAENEWRGEAGIESELLALEVKQEPLGPIKRSEMVS